MSSLEPNHLLKTSPPILGPWELRLLRIIDARHHLEYHPVDLGHNLCFAASESLTWTIYHRQFVHLLWRKDSHIWTKIVVEKLNDTTISANITCFSVDNLGM